MNTSNIYITNSTVFQLDYPIVNHGLDLAPFNRYNKCGLKKFQQIAVHYSVTRTAKGCYDVLKARGLSANFSIDDDDNNGYATIYQHLPLDCGGWSQGGVFNTLGRGIEICYLPDPKTTPKDYHLLHPLVTDTVHNVRFRYHTPSEAQYRSLQVLISGICRQFRDIRPFWPRDDNGELIKTTVSGAEMYYGIVQHYHVSRSKIDTVGLDMDRIENFLMFDLRV